MITSTSIPSPEATFEGNSPPLVESTCGDDGHKHVKKNSSAVGGQPQLQSLHQQNNDDIKSSSPAFTDINHRGGGEGNDTHIAFGGEEENDVNFTSPRKKSLGKGSGINTNSISNTNNKKRKANNETWSNDVVGNYDSSCYDGTSMGRQGKKKRTRHHSSSSCVKLYRTLRSDENPRDKGGLVPADRQATCSIAEHVENGSTMSTQIISTTKDIVVAAFYASKSHHDRGQSNIRIAELSIDISQLEEHDATRLVGNNQSAINLSRSMDEYVFTEEGAKKLRVQRTITIDDHLLQQFDGDTNLKRFRSAFNKSMLSALMEQAVQEGGDNDITLQLPTPKGGMCKAG